MALPWIYSRRYLSMEYPSRIWTPPPLNQRWFDSYFAVYLLLTIHFLYYLKNKYSVRHLCGRLWVVVRVQNFCCRYQLSIVRVRSNIQARFFRRQCSLPSRGTSSRVWSASHSDVHVCYEQECSPFSDCHGNVNNAVPYSFSGGN